MTQASEKRLDWGRLALLAMLLATTAACSSAPPTPVSAAEAFQKIQERIEKAKTLSVKFQVLGLQPGSSEKGEMKGSILIKEGNRVRIETTAQVAGSVDALFVCDGRTMLWSSMGQTNDKGGPTDLGGRFLTAFARAGYQGVLMEKLRLSGSQEIPGPMTFEIRDVQTASEESLAYALSFAVEGQVTTLKGRLWYDPRTWDLSKRELRISMQGREIVIAETYDAFAVNGELSNDLFSLLAKATSVAAPVPGREHRSFEWWSGHAAGSWAKYQGQLIVAGAGKVESTVTLQEISGTNAVVETRTIRTSPRGNREPESVEKKQYSKETEQEPIMILKEGDEEIEIAGRKLKCHWIEGSS